MSDKFLRRLFLLVAGAVVLASSAALAESNYPQVDISGFKKWELKKVDVDNSRNYFAALSQLGGFYPTFTGGPWQERLQLRILGKLSEKLSVGYDLEQQPETPEKYDVKVKYDTMELTFGDLTANFSGNDFVSASKYMNGVMFTAKDGWYDLTLVPSGKLKSQNQNITSQYGNNTAGPYNLGHNSIVEGTEQIQLNNIFLKRGVDYTIDYFEGKITFKKMLSTTDEFKYSYEYTNLLDIFFPTLSKQDFIGFQSRFTLDPEKFGKPEPRPEPVVGSARETFPSVGTIEPEAQEEEAFGQYRTKNYPIKIFSERINFMGTTLKKNEDYVIRYETGEIKLLTRFLPSAEDPISIEYDYFQTSSEAETIAGIGSRGPYRTKYAKIVPGSEKIQLDGKPFAKDLDYVIDYEKGEINFYSVIGPTSQISISYGYSVLALPFSFSSKYPKELKLGATYLKQTAKKGETAATNPGYEIFTGKSIISNHYTAFLSNRALPSTIEAAPLVQLTRAGVTRALSWETDYTIPTTEVNPSTGLVVVHPSCQLSFITDRADPSDGYRTGTMFFYNDSLALLETDVITISYSFKKNVVGKHQELGNGGKGPYFIKNFREIVPGSETVQVWDVGSSSVVTYTRNSSFEADANETGYSINYDISVPSITFNSPLPSTKNFQIVFKYIPPTNAPQSNDISQSALGIDGSFKIGDVFRVDTAFARSESDQIFIAETTVESFFGNNTKIYVLKSPKDLVDGREKIYVNNYLLNRDVDYSINYTLPGTINFYYITPSSKDAISVTYDYQSDKGSDVGQGTKSDTAFRMGGETRIFGDALILSGNTKRIGFNFSPLGGTPIGVGSDYEEYNVNFKPGFHSFYTNYSYKYNKNPIGSSRQYFLRSYDNIVNAGFNPAGAAKIDLGYRSYSTLDDPVSRDALHTSDNQQEAFTGSLIPSEWRKGLLIFNQRYDLRKTTSKNDYLDRGTSLSTTNINYYHAGADLKVADRLMLGLDYQLNEPVTVGSLETETARSKSIDTSYNINMDLTMLFLQKWLARVSLLDHNEQITLPTPSLISTKNETYHMDINPFSILTTSFDHNRQERISYLSGQENPLSLRTTAVARLAPVSWFSIGANVSKGENIPETGTANRAANRAISYDADYTVFSLPAIRFNARFLKSDGYQIGPFGVESIKTDTNSFSQNYTLGISRIAIMPITLGLLQEDYSNKNNSVTLPVTTETQNQTLTASVKLSLPKIPLLSLSGDYYKKTTRNLLTGENRPKQVVSGKAAYQITGWGNLAFELIDERNHGEVQGGSILNLDIKKTTQSYSLNINMPVNNPVLTNFVVVASLKNIAYTNYKNSLDNFNSSLMSFEGTLNF